MNNSNHFDIIIIGSGLGGMTVASLASQFMEKRVLLIEQHSKIGGYTHLFKRQQKYAWDVGIHYIGDMAEGSMSRSLFDMVTNSSVGWQRMSEPFQKFVYPDFTIPVIGNEQSYKQTLIDFFPQEAAAISLYFKDIKKVAAWMGRHLTMKALPSFLDGISNLLERFGHESALITTKQYLDQTFQDERLKAVLVSEWGDYGLPPAQSSFAIHALIANHYLQGGYYPIGGGEGIGQSIIPLIEKRQGKILLSHRVSEIIVSQNKAVGVRVQNRKSEKNEFDEYFAPIIVSNAGAYNTFVSLLAHWQQNPYRQPLQDHCQRNPITSNVTLFLGLKDSPQTLGVHGENHWIYDDYDHDLIHSKRNEIIDSRVHSCFISFPSQKDPMAKGQTAEIIAFADYQAFLPWRDMPWRKRGDDYLKLKQNISQALLAYADRHIPGLSNLVEYHELSTPLTNEHFSAHPFGHIYGLPCNPDRFRREKSPWNQSRTPLSGLYLTGADATTPGIIGALMSGFVTISVIQDGISLIKLIKNFLK